MGLPSSRPSLGERNRERVRERRKNRHRRESAEEMNSSWEIVPLSLCESTLSTRGLKTAAVPASSSSLSSARFCSKTKVPFSTRFRMEWYSHCWVSACEKGRGDAAVGRGGRGGETCEWTTEGGRGEGKEKTQMRRERWRLEKAD
jgi:hypothetical protein